MTTRLAAIVAVLLLGFSCKLANKAPDVPVVFGPSAGTVGVPVTFKATATDPEGDSISFGFDWSDSAGPAWTALVANGETVTVTKSFTYGGPFQLRVKSRDNKGKESGWSQVHTVTVAIVWRRTYGGAAVDEANSVQQTQDGGYVAVGRTWSYGAGTWDIWLVKVDAAGDTAWTRTFGGARNEEGNSVQQTQDGGYIVAGTTNSYGAGVIDAWLIKTDASGNRLWDRTIGGSDFDEGYSVQQTQDGGYVVAGSTWSSRAGDYDFWLIKTGSTGDTVWTRTFGGPANDIARSVQQTQDGGYIIAGSCDLNRTGINAVWLVRTAANGDTVWTRAFGGVSYDEGFSVQQTQDGGYVVAGSTMSYSAGDSDVWLIKTDALGTKTWDRTFGGGGQDWANSVRQTQDGGYVIAGATENYGAGEIDAWVVKTDANGDTTWTRTFGGAKLEEGKSIQQTQDGGYVIAGSTNSYGAGSDDMWLIKTDAQGNTAP